MARRRVWVRVPVGCLAVFCVRSAQACHWARIGVGPKRAYDKCTAHQGSRWAGSPLVRMPPQSSGFLDESSFTIRRRSRRISGRCPELLTFRTRYASPDRDAKARWKASMAPIGFLRSSVLKKSHIERNRNPVGGRRKCSRDSGAGGTGSTQSGIRVTGTGDFLLITSRQNEDATHNSCSMSNAGIHESGKSVVSQ